MRFFRQIFAFFIVFLIVLCGCNRGKKADSIHFDPMVNFRGDDTILLDIDMKGVVNQGIVIPSMRQCEGGKFVFEFKSEKRNTNR